MDRHPLSRYRPLALAAACFLLLGALTGRDGALAQHMAENPQLLQAVLWSQKSPIAHSTRLLEALLTGNQPLLRAGKPSPSSEAGPEPSPAPEPVPDPDPAPVPDTPQPTEQCFQPVSGSGYDYIDKLYILNNSGKELDLPALLAQDLELPASGDPLVLILHTHGTEAYTPGPGEEYVLTDRQRSTDTAYNVVRIGDELESVLESRGISCVHDRTLYDYPSYSGSYGRSLAAAEALLAQYPSIRYIFDVHRDALEGSDGTVYKPVARLEGEKTAQIMLVVGTDASGLEHPDWQNNLRFALELQGEMNDAWPTLARPIHLRESRFNQHLSPRALIVETGAGGNTLPEALSAIRLFGQSAADVILNA